MKTQIKVPVPSDIWAKVRTKEEAHDGFELDEFVDQLVTYANAPSSGDYGRAGAAGETLENWEGTFFTRKLTDFRTQWYLHAALIGHRIMLRAGYLWNGCDDDGRRGDEGGDFASPLFFVNNANEVWGHVFREDLRRTVTLLDDGGEVLQVRFERENEA